MAVAFVNGLSTNATNTGSFSVTLGNLILIGADGNTLPATGMNDTQGNTWHLIRNGT